jgi:hypothetical protein
MNGFKFCKNVLKYNGKVLSVNFNELKPCLNQNFNALKTSGYNNALLVKDFIKNGKQEDKDEVMMWLCGFIGAVCAYVIVLSNMKGEKIDLLGVCFIIVVSMGGGVFGASIGYFYELIPLMLIFIGPIILHNKRIKE